MKGMRVFMKNLTVDRNQANESLDMDYTHNKIFAYESLVPKLLAKMKKNYEQREWDSLGITADYVATLGYKSEDFGLHQYCEDVARLCQRMKTENRLVILEKILLAEMHFRAHRMLQKSQVQRELN